MREDVQRQMSGEAQQVPRKQSSYQILRGINDGRRERKENPRECRHRIGDVLESRAVEILVVLLIVLDIACIFTEIAIDKNRVCFSPTPIGDHAASSHSALKVPGDTVLHAAIPGAVAHVDPHADAHVGIQPNGTHLRLLSVARALAASSHTADFSCSGVAAHKVHQLAHEMSIAILTIMALELIAKLIVDCKEFCSNRFHVFDFVIVCISLVVDVTLWIFKRYFTTEEEEIALTMVALINFSRFWRIVRILHGIVEGFLIEHDYMHKLEEQMGKMRDHCTQNGIPIPEEMDVENQRLMMRYKASTDGTVESFLRKYCYKREPEPSSSSSDSD